MKKEYWIYTLISILIVAIAIIGFFVFVHFKYGDQSGQSHKSETKNYEDIHIAIVNEDQSTTYNGIHLLRNYLVKRTIILRRLRVILLKMA